MNAARPLFLAVSIAAAAASAAPWKDPQAGGNAIPYGTVSEALAALKSKPGVTIQGERPERILIAEADRRTQWSFTAVDDPSHPAVVRRIVRASSGARSEVSILCEIRSAHCEKLLVFFKRIDDLAGTPILAPKPQASAASQ
jgi:hypothetical protein